MPVRVAPARAMQGWAAKPDETSSSWHDELHATTHIPGNRRQAVIWSDKKEWKGASKDATSSIEIEAYPNPFSNTTTVLISKDGDNEQVQIELYELSGQMVSTSRQNTNEQFQIGNEVRSGVYILKVIHSDGVESIKLVKTE